MTKLDRPSVNQDRLVEEWQSALTNILHDGDESRIWADEADSQAIRVHITTRAKHSLFTFDFKVSYVDAREVKVDLVDVEQNEDHLDAGSDEIQAMIEDYVRHLHECAQTLKKVTSS